MFSVLTAIALTLGGVSSTMVLNEGDRLAAEEMRAPLVELASQPAAAPSSPASSTQAL